MRHETEDYCDQRLAGMEIVLDRTMRTVQAGPGRSSRRSRRRPSGPCRSRAGEDEESEGERFFDQDRTVGGRVPRRSIPFGGPRRADCVVQSLGFGGTGAGGTRFAGPDRSGPLSSAGRPPTASCPTRPRRPATSCSSRSSAGIMATGTVSAPWRGVCRRCADPVGGELAHRASGSGSVDRRPARARTTRRTRSSTTRSTWARWSAMRSCSSCRWPRSAGTAAAGLCPTCGADRNHEDCGCVAPRTRVGLTSTCSGRPSQRRPGETDRPAGRPAAGVEHDPGELTMAVPKKKTSKAKGRSRQAANWRLELPPRSVCPHCHEAKAPARRLPQLRLVQGSAGGRGRLT